MKTITDPQTGITLALPSGWRLARASLSAYCDPQAPQYNLLLSCERLPLEWLHAGSLADHARRLCAANPLAREVRLDEPEGPRLLARYRSVGVEQGQRKDDRHWLVLEQNDSALMVALLTLSVLADQADPEETERQARALGDEISRLTFPKEAPPLIAGPSSALQEKVDLLEDVTLSLCQGLCEALDAAPIDKQGLVAASLGICLYWLARWQGAAEEALEDGLAEALQAQVIAGFCASLDGDAGRARAAFEELEPTMARQSRSVIEPLAELFESAPGEGLERATLSFGVKLLLLTTTLFRDAPIEAEALAGQSEQIQSLGRVVMAAPALIQEALSAANPEEPELESFDRPSTGMLANALLGPQLL